MIVIRVYKGVADHFPIRFSEWVMLWPAFGMWIVFQISPNMFSVSPSFSVLASWAEEGTWALVLAACGVARLTALTVNGTFPGFAYSPHFRAGASIFGALIWSQFSLGFFMAYLASGGAASGAVTWSTMVLLEIMNTYRSWADIGKNRRRHE